MSPKKVGYMQRRNKVEGGCMSPKKVRYMQHAGRYTSEPHGACHPKNQGTCSCTAVPKIGDVVYDTLKIKVHAAIPLLF